MQQGPPPLCRLTVRGWFPSKLWLYHLSPFASACMFVPDRRALVLHTRLPRGRHPLGAMLRPKSACGVASLYRHSMCSVLPRPPRLHSWSRMLLTGKVHDPLASCPYRKLAQFTTVDSVSLCYHVTSWLGTTTSDVGSSMRTCYLVDPASSHMLVSKIKPCMCKYELIRTVKLRMAH